MMSLTMVRVSMLAAAAMAATVAAATEAQTEKSSFVKASVKLDGESYSIATGTLDNTAAALAMGHKVMKCRSQPKRAQRYTRL
jgi:hypothetical protein